MPRVFYFVAGLATGVYLAQNYTLPSVQETWRRLKEELGKLKKREDEEEDG